MDRITENNIVDEVKKSFIDYSMSVIVSRAIPDLKDGLKPVHRRILYTMFEDGLTPDKQYRKCAKTVGDVMGNYHPHGDSSIYDAMVRMAQDFSYRYMLVDGHGNFGNMDGDGAAAYRYTEAKLSKISLELLKDINKNTVDFMPNFDETKEEPIVLPSRFPNILVNGTMGIAVGMATNIPPHNLGEVIDGCVAYIDNPNIELPELMQLIKGPDFPTGGIILGNSGIKKAYETGRGSITIRCKAAIEDEHGRSKIVISELPYGINTLELKTKIGDLVRSKMLDGISDYHDATSLDTGVNIIITLKKEANPNVVLNNLYKHTQLQSSFGIILLMLDNGVPKTLGLKDIISKYIDHQKDVIVRRTQFELSKAENRVHILEGLKIALDHIDEIIKLIKAAKSDDEALKALIDRFNLSEAQGQAILEMKLRRLTGLERGKIENELNELLELINTLRAILASEEKVLSIIKDEMLEIKQKYADERRTTIDMSAIEYIEDESLIPENNVMITLTKNGYIKRLVSESYKTQNRGGVGVKGITTNEEDYVEHLINLSTHDYVLFFTNKGKVYRLKGYEIPEFSKQSKGLPIINLLQVEKGEIVNSIIKLSKDDDSKYLLFATKKGIVKRTKVEDFDNIRATGKISIKLKDNDELIAVRKTDGAFEVLMASAAGRLAKFNENDVRVMGRTASGVRGINLNGSECIGAEVATPEQEIIFVTEKGYGKKTKALEYRLSKRGGKGVKTMSITEKNGNLSSFKIAYADHDLMIITNTGMIIRMPLEQVSSLGRVTQGVRLINIKNEQKVATISVVPKPENDEPESESND